MLGGGRALLMQVAHPLVAAGVVAHSDYRENPWERLERTMSAVWTIVFGNRAEADRAVGAGYERWPMPIFIVFSWNSVKARGTIDGTSATVC